jgi:hypothetical protein
MSDMPQFPKRGQRPPGRSTLPGFITLVFMFIALSWTVYSSFRIDIGEGEMAILIKKVGKDLTNGEEVAPSEEYKGIQRKVLTEGRYFFNPYTWSWQVIKQTEISSGEDGSKGQSDR